MILRRVLEHVRSQNWTAIAIDFLIVVAGILIAFQITEWNEDRRERIRERDYLVRIADELDQSIMSIEHGIRRSQERESYGRFLIAAAADPALVRAEPGRLVASVLFAGFTFSPAIRSHTFDEIKSTGDLDIFRDKDLLFDLSEFYTEVNLSQQWHYLREVKQTEYLRRAAGILTYEQIAATTKADGALEIPVAEAMAVYERMLTRPRFVEWLPTVADRSDETGTYRKWHEMADQLRSRIRATPGLARPGEEKVNATSP